MCDLKHLPSKYSFQSYTFLSPFFLKKPLKKAWLKQKIIENEQDLFLTPHKKNIFICKNCSYPIANEKDLIKISNSYFHDFSNPSGIRFKIICFKTALGIINFGELTNDFSWFPDYAWCFSHCTNCHLHLGWLFNSGIDQFYGIIYNKLVQSSVSENS